MTAVSGTWNTNIASHIPTSSKKSSSLLAEKLWNFSTHQTCCFAKTHGKSKDQIIKEALVFVTQTGLCWTVRPCFFFHLRQNQRAPLTFSAGSMSATSCVTVSCWLVCPSVGRPRPWTVSWLLHFLMTFLRRSWCCLELFVHVFFSSF